MELNKAFVEAVEELIQETKCPICLDFFSNPRSAPCQHNFCEECIWEVIKDNHSECPTCRYPGCNRRSLAKNNTLCNVTIIVRKLAASLGLAEAPTEQSKFEKVWPPKPSPRKRPQKRGKRARQSPPDSENQVRDDAAASERLKPEEDEDRGLAQEARFDQPATSVPSSPVLSIHHNYAEQEAIAGQEAAVESKRVLSLGLSRPAATSTTNSHAIESGSESADKMHGVVNTRTDRAGTVAKEKELCKKSREWQHEVFHHEAKTQELQEPAHGGRIQQAAHSGPSDYAHSGLLSCFARTKEELTPRSGERTGLQTPRMEAVGLHSGAGSAKSTVKRGEDLNADGCLPCKRKSTSFESEEQNRADAGAAEHERCSQRQASGPLQRSAFTTPLQRQDALRPSRPSPRCLTSNFGSVPASTAGEGGALSGADAQHADSLAAARGGALRHREGSALLREGAQGQGRRAAGGRWGRGGRCGGPSIVMTGLSREEASLLRLYVGALGGDCGEQYQEGVTHVVCKVDGQRLTARTLKYCCGLLSGAAMVTAQWVKRCKTEGRWREPAGDERVAGCVITHKVHKGVRAREALGGGREGAGGGGCSASGLLAPSELGGRAFCLVGRFGNPCKEDLRLLLRLAGAEVLEEEPATDEQRQRTIVVCGEQSADQERVQALSDGGAVVVKPAFVMDSISQYKPQPMEHYLKTRWVAGERQGDVML